MWHKFTGCGHEILGWIMQVEHHCQEHHQSGDQFTFTMVSGTTDELEDVFPYTVP